MREKSSYLGKWQIHFSFTDYLESPQILIKWRKTQKKCKGTNKTKQQSWLSIKGYLSGRTRRCEEYERRPLGSISIKEHQLKNIVRRRLLKIGKNSGASRSQEKYQCGCFECGIGGACKSSSPFIPCSETDVLQLEHWL